MSTKRLGKNVLSLNDFLHRSKVLSYYRKMLRASLNIEGESSRELANSIRSAFKERSNEKDRDKIKQYFSEASFQLKHLESMVRISRNKYRPLLRRRAAPCTSLSLVRQYAHRKPFATHVYHIQEITLGTRTRTENVEVDHTVTEESGTLSSDSAGGSVGKGWPWDA